MSIKFIKLKTYCLFPITQERKNSSISYLLIKTNFYEKAELNTFNYLLFYT